MLSFTVNAVPYVDLCVFPIDFLLVRLVTQFSERHVASLTHD